MDNDLKVLLMEAGCCSALSVRDFVTLTGTCPSDISFGLMTVGRINLLNLSLNLPMVAAYCVKLAAAGT